jgi:hypothetical protein
MIPLPPDQQSVDDSNLSLSPPADADAQWVKPSYLPSHKSGGWATPKASAQSSQGGWLKARVGSPTNK